MPPLKVNNVKENETFLNLKSQMILCPRSLSSMTH